MPGTDPKYITFQEPHAFLWPGGGSLPSPICPPCPLIPRLSLEAHGHPEPLATLGLRPAWCSSPPPRPYRLLPPLTCCAQTAGSLGHRQGPSTPLGCDLGREERRHGQATVSHQSLWCSCGDDPSSSAPRMVKGLWVRRSIGIVPGVFHFLHLYPR